MAAETVVTQGSQLLDAAIAVVGVVAMLSVAAERLVEIIKGLVPWLNTARTAPDEEGQRRSALHILSVVCGVLTAWLAKDVMQPTLGGAVGAEVIRSVWFYLGLGVLASGGSSMWNSILTYLLSVKDLKRTEARNAAAIDAGGAQAGLPVTMPALGSATR
jgi:hypothetical protein